MGNPLTINSFSGEYSWLSNMELLEKPIIHEDISYYSVENFYQAMKTTDEITRVSIANVPPRKSKNFSRKIVLRPDWEQVKVIIMAYGINEKFNADKLKNKLMNTGDVEIIEGNYWQNKFWGVDSMTGEGHNVLGKLIMHKRKLLLMRVAEVIH